MSSFTFAIAGLVDLDAEPWALRQTSQVCVAVLLQSKALTGDAGRHDVAVEIAFLDQEERDRCGDVQTGAQAEFAACVVRWGPRERDTLLLEG